MQKFYPYKVLDEEAQTSDSTTFTKVLPSEGQATGIDIEMRATNGATSNVNNLLIENITKLELTGDGVDKILSLPGYALWKYLWAIQGKPSVGDYTEWASEVQNFTLKYPFGRYYGDTEYMLNLAKYKEVRLDIQYNLATKTAVGVTGFTTGSLTFKIDLMKTLPGVSMASKGVRRVVERKSLLTVASGELPWEFVQDYPYTAIIPYCKNTDGGSETFTDIKLDLGGGKPILVDRTFLEIMQRNIVEMGIDPTFTGKYYAQHGDYIYTRARGIDNCAPHHVGMGVPGTNSMIICTPGTYGRDRARLVIAALDPVSSVPSAAGLCLINATTKHVRLGDIAYIPLSDYPHWTNPLMPADVKDALLLMTQSGAGGTAKVITEQILPQ